MQSLLSRQKSPSVELGSRFGFIPTSLLEADDASFFDCIQATDADDDEDDDDYDIVPTNEDDDDIVPTYYLPRIIILSLASGRLTYH